MRVPPGSSHGLPLRSSAYLLPSGRSYTVYAAAITEDAVHVRDRFHPHSFPLLISRPKPTPDARRAMPIAAR